MTDSTVFQEASNVLTEATQASVAQTEAVQALTAEVAGKMDHINQKLRNILSFEVGGTANAITLTTELGLSPITTLNNFDEFTFIVAETNTSSTVTIKIDELDAVSLSGISSDTQIFETALLTVRYVGGAFYIAEQINPKLGSNVLDIGKLYTDTVDILRPGEYALDGSSLSRSDHPIAFAIVSVSSNYVDQSTKDADPIAYGGYYGDGDGLNTFTLPMVGGEFIRMYDESGVKSDQDFAEWRDSENRSHRHLSNGTGAQNNGGGSGGSSDLGTAVRQYTEYSGGSEARPRAIAYYGKTRL
jgi:hypothetical protein